MNPYCISFESDINNTGRKNACGGSIQHRFQIIVDHILISQVGEFFTPFWEITGPVVKLLICVFALIIPNLKPFVPMVDNFFLG